MIKGLLARKIGMTQVFEEGKIVPVTILKAGPCTIVQKKTIEKDGYNAVQLGFDEKAKPGKKPLEGHFKKNNLKTMRVLKEIRIDDPSKVEVGQTMFCDVFTQGDYVSITGITKGRGYQGVMRRHNFKGGPGSHGSMFKRAPGGIGGRVRVAGHIWKGRRMAGHMGMDNVTTSNLKVVLIDKDENIILVKGCIPGNTLNTVIIKEAIKNQALKLKDTRIREEEQKRIAAQIAKDKADKAKKKAPSRPAGGKK
jgi:large subunit ribosomal protein L3